MSDVNLTDTEREALALPIDASAESLACVFEAAVSNGGETIDGIEAVLEAINESTALTELVDRARAEVASDYDHLVARQGDLLTGVANALRGDPPPLTSWSHHDLPDLARETAVRAAALAPIQAGLARQWWIEHVTADGTDRAWAEAAWNDMGGSEPSQERVDYEIRAENVLAALAAAGVDAAPGETTTEARA